MSLYDLNTTVFIHLDCEFVVYNNEKRPCEVNDYNIILRFLVALLEHTVYQIW